MQPETKLVYQPGVGIKCGVTTCGDSPRTTEVPTDLTKPGAYSGPCTPQQQLQPPPQQHTIMQAVVFKGKLQVALETRPRPQIEDPKDVILKVRYTALCGR